MQRIVQTSLWLIIGVRALMAALFASVGFAWAGAGAFAVAAWYAGLAVLVGRRVWWAVWVAAAANLALVVAGASTLPDFGHLHGGEILAYLAVPALTELGLESFVLAKTRALRAALPRTKSRTTIILAGVALVLFGALVARSQSHRAEAERRVIAVVSGIDSNDVYRGCGDRACGEFIPTLGPPVRAKCNSSHTDDGVEWWQCWVLLNGPKCILTSVKHQEDAWTIELGDHANAGCPVWL